MRRQELSREKEPAEVTGRDSGLGPALPLPQGERLWFPCSFWALFSVFAVAEACLGTGLQLPGPITPGKSEPPCWQAH